MTKLELIAELLTEELHTFQSEIGRLEKVDKNLRDVRIRADSTRIEQIVERHLNQDSMKYGLLLDKIEKIENEVKNARIAPNWIIGFVLILFLSMAFVIVYLLIAEV